MAPGAGVLRQASGVGRAGLPSDSVSEGRTGWCAPLDLELREPELQCLWRITSPRLEIEMDWDENLPDVSAWQPHFGSSQTLSNGLLLTCQAIQSRIVREAEIERRFRIRNFDSGPGVEDLVRRELSQLLPSRYSVDAGVVNDRDGNTAEDFDLLIHNQAWAPAIKLGATPDSRRFHYPIENIYSAIEIKQTVGFRELDMAMEKLVKLSRLNRPSNPYGHITENQHIPLFDKSEFTLNPLQTVVFGTRIGEGISFQDIAMRFGRINAELRREDMVRELCVLDQGVAMYMVANGSGGYVEADFMRDRSDDLVMAIYDQEPENALFILFIHTLGHLTRSVLQIHDLPRQYGDFQPASKFTSWQNALFNQRRA